jgi:CheY-like chemotaxis protein
MLLRTWGYDCRVAYDGAAGLRAAGQYRPDCVLLDLAMPGMDGYTLAREVRAQPGLGRVRLVTLTAYSDEAHVRRSREAGFDLHFIKPTEPLEVRSLMDILSQWVQLADRAEEVARQDVAPASETEGLIKEVREARTEEHPGDGKSPEPEPEGEDEGAGRHARPCLNRRRDIIS